MSAAEAGRTDTLPSSTEQRLRGQANPYDRSETSVLESSSQSSAVKALDVAGSQHSPRGRERHILSLACKNIPAEFQDRAMTFAMQDFIRGHP